MPPTPAESLARIAAQFQEMTAVLSGPHAERVSSISRWRPIEHIEHVVRAAELGFGQIEKGIERDGGPPIHLLGRFMQWSGWIPRGIGKSPEMVKATGLDAAEIQRRLAGASAAFDGLRARESAILNARGRARHPYFGGFTPVEWLRFIAVHQEHHLKIVREIAA